MKPVLSLALSLSFLLLSSVPVIGAYPWPLLPDANFLWQNSPNSTNREGNLWDVAGSVAVKDGRVFAVGESETTAGSGAFTVKTYDSSNGSLLWDSYYDREGDGWDSASDVVVDGKNIFVSGYTTTAAGGSALTVRAYKAKDGRLLWEDNYDREGAGWDAAWGMTVHDNKVFSVGQTTSTTGDSAFAVRAYNAKNGKLLWEDNYDREGAGWDAAYRTIAKDNRVFVVGQTRSAAGGNAFAVRAYDASNGALLWQDNYDREGALTDVAWRAAVKDGKLFVVGDSETTAGGSAYAIRTYDTSSGNLLWKNDYDREGSFQDEALNVAVVGDSVYTTGTTGTTHGNALTVRAYNVSNGNLLYADYQTPEASKHENWAIGIAAEEESKVFVSGTTETTAGGASFAVRAYRAVTSTSPPTL